MKIQVLYFAQFREALGKATEEVEIDQQEITVGELLEIVRHLSPLHRATLQNTKRVRMARNEELCFKGRLVQDGDTVAFFPPVTGG